MNHHIIEILLTISLVTAYQDHRLYFSSGFIGCFKDQGNPRTLGDQLENKFTNTGSRCKQRCKQRGYRYAGTEAANQCFCSQHLIGVKADNGDCNIPCFGNRSEHCGGVWFVAVYDNNPEKMIRSSGYIGCYDDESTGTHHSTLSQNISVGNANYGQECKGKCEQRGYRYAGTENGSDCYCGNAHPPQKVSKSECYYTCPGNRDEYCGGDLRLSVYSIRTRTTNLTSVRTTTMLTTSNATISLSLLTQESSLKTSRYLSSTEDFRNSSSNSPGITTSMFPSLSISYSADVVTSPTFPQGNSHPQSEHSTTDKTKHSTTDKTKHSTTNKTKHSRTNQTTYLLPVPVIAPTNFAMVSTISSSTTDQTRLSTFSNGQVNTTTTVTDSEWFEINGKELLIVGRNGNFYSAQSMCKNLSAELLSYSDPMQYLQLPSKKKLKDNSYWIGVHLGKLDNECPILHSNNNEYSFRLANCTDTHYFICSRAINITHADNDLVVVHMLKDMTVNKHVTSRGKRRLTSARDQRRSSICIGTVGIIVMCAIVALFVFFRHQLETMSFC